MRRLARALPSAYPYFHKAIREKYPDIKLIGSASPFAAGGEYERGWASARECGCDLIDEHYYMNTDWMIANVDRYDNFLSSDPKVFLGEYASWGNQWENGLAEAAFMTGLEKMCMQLDWHAMRRCLQMWIM